MAAGAVVERLDVVEDGGAGFAPGGEVAAMNQFIFQAAPERFHRGIVVAVALAAHRGDEAMVGQCRAVICSIVSRFEVLPISRRRWLTPFRLLATASRPDRKK